jgi:hypothetical protein
MPPKVPALGLRPRIPPSAIRGFYDQSAQKYEPAEIAAQVDKIRAEILQHGESRVGCAELVLLCTDEVSPNAQLTGIMEIAEWERWAFEYLPDGSVRFTSL